MIGIKNLTYSYPEAGSPALKDINLEIDDGEFVLIIGPTGSGKSTLLNCINGIIPHVFSGSIAGDVVVDGILPRETPVAEMSKTVGTVFQNPESQIFMLRVEDDVAFGCENLLIPVEEIIKRRETALSDMGLLDLRNSETSSLSGGMKQRLAIASVYAMGPRILLFDEPTADLDSVGRTGFLNIIKELKARGHTILLAEHQYDDFLPVADRVICLKAGSITAMQGHEGIYDIAGRGYLNKALTITDDSGIISLRGVTFGYTKQSSALSDVSINIKKGEVIAICGDNGSGKTTLLKVMAGLLKPLKGEVVVSGITNPSMEGVIGRIGFLFQNPDEQLFANTVEEEIMFSPMVSGKEVDINRYSDILDILDFGKIKTRHPQMLSRGQRQLLAILSVLTVEPGIIILDEPTTGLDMDNLKSLFMMIYKMAEGGKTVVFSTHNKMLKEFAHRVILLKDGMVVKDEIFW